MTTVTALKNTIDAAEKIAGGLRPLARMLNTNASNLIAMRKGERPCPIGIRARLAELVEEDPVQAMLEGLVAKLDTNDYHEAQLAVILQGVADSLTAAQKEENPAGPKIDGVLHAGGTGGIRTLDEALHPILP